MPLDLLRSLSSIGLADLDGLADGFVRIDSAVSGLAPGAPIPCPPEQYDVPRRVEAMTRSGLDIQVVSAPPFLFASGAQDENLVLDTVRRSNDALAAFVAESPQQMVALATIPIGVPGAAEEIVRCLDELGMAGATVGTFGAGRELDDEKNEDVWALLAARSCFTLMHPSRVSSIERVSDYHLVQLLGFPVETALATARLVLSGVLDRHDLVLCLAHGGGCLPGVSPRLDLGWERKDVARSSELAPSSYLGRLLYDTAVFDTTTLRRLIEDVSSANVLLGTDSPFDLEDRTPLQTIEALGLTRREADEIRSSNALRLIPQLTTARPSGDSERPGRYPSYESHLP